jgi:outer membrane protein assembly factor BamB
MSLDDNLEERALRARASLRAAEADRPIPALPTRQPSSPALRGWAAPALAALAVVAVVLGVGLGGRHVARVVVAAGTIASVPAGRAPVAATTDGRTTWVADAGSGTVVAFDARTLKQKWSRHVGGRPVALALGFGAVWTVDAAGERLLKLAPATGAVVGEARTSLNPVALDVAFGSVWVLSSGNQTVDRYDPATVTQTASAVLGAAGRALAHSRASLWVTVSGGLRRISPTPGLPVLAVPLDRDPRWLAADGSEVVWVGFADGSLLPVDGITGTARGAPITLTTPLTALIAVGDDVLAATGEGLIRRFEATGGPGTVLATTSSPWDAIASRGGLLVGTARSTARLYATEISP